jgi:hypothetical protein
MTEECFGMNWFSYVVGGVFRGVLGVTLILSAIWVRYQVKLVLPQLFLSLLNSSLIKASWISLLLVVTVKVHGPYSLSKDALREEECPWLIKSTRQGSLSNVGHFNTPPHVWHLWPNTCSTTGGKDPSLSKELALIPCKSPWALLPLKRRLERGENTMAYKVPRWRKS